MINRDASLKLGYIDTPKERDKEPDIMNPKLS